MSNNTREENQAIISNAMAQIIAALGENSDRPGIKDTPLRVAKSLLYLTDGYNLHPSDIVGNAVFPCESEGMIVQKDIEFFSLCEHHLLPFFGRAHVAYLPDKKIIGLSKVGRIIDIFAKRLQVQEHLTHQIAHSIHDLLKPKGVAVMIEAQHFCMMMRGVQKQGALTITSEYLGEFKNDQAVKSDFLKNIQR
jgi:GTP cyclohydrolase IA